MTHEELKYKESRLRECFKKKLEMLEVDGYNDIDAVKCIKTYGMLWHLAHQLLMAEEHEETTEKRTGSVTTADTMNIQTTGLKMTGGIK